MFVFFSIITLSSSCFFFFFFNDTATTEIYTLSLHDALPISDQLACRTVTAADFAYGIRRFIIGLAKKDRKSTRLNSSHDQISYAVFCLKKKKQQQLVTTQHTMT